MALCVLTSCGDSAPAPGEGQSPAQILSAADVVVATPSDVAAGVRVTGSLDPHQVIEIKAQIAGTVRELRTERGAAVKRGETMARIEAEGVRGEAAGARASVAAAQASLAEARQRLEGARELHAAGAMSAVDFRGAEAQYESAQAQLASARAQFAGASENARRASVQAPIDGVVSERAISEGEAVSVGQKLFTVVNSEYLDLSGQIAVQSAPQVRVGQQVTFTLDAYPGEQLTASVARIDPVADPATRRVGVTVQIPNPRGKLVGGQFVTGSIVAAGGEEVLLVPESALRGTLATPYLLLVEGDRIARRAVTVGRRIPESNQVAITAGLKQGDRVIVSPATNLEVGARVRLPSPNGSTRRD